MRNVVIGAGFGDEGKGLVVDWLASKDNTQLVKRYCGGHQVGHCVRTETEKHIFSNFGSGTMRGIPTLWNAKTVDPVGFMNEYELIKKWNPVIQINPLCPVTTPWDKIDNRSADNSTKHGSVGVGFGSTIQREEANVHLYFHDLFYPWVLSNKIAPISKYYDKQIKLPQSTLERFLLACDRMTRIVQTVIDDPDSKIIDNVIYESAQGLLLDMDYGIFPHVTRSRLGTQEIRAELECMVPPHFYLVTRAYQTRHGNGPCGEFNFEPVNADETNSSEGFQGEFKTRVLDLDMLHYAMTIDPMIRESKNKSLVVTCLDHVVDHRVIWQGVGHSFPTERRFLEFIINKLHVTRLFTSHGPTAKDVKRFSW